MSILVELRKVSIEFRRLSSNLLRTKRDDDFLYLKRLYIYMNEQPTIQKIINDAISCSNYDCEQFITQDNHWGHGNQVNVPLKEVDHIKAIYSFWGELAEYEGKSLYSVASSFERPGKSFDETIQSFLEKTFKPLIDYIVDSLSKEMMTMEPATQFNQHIQNNYGTANVGETITSTNTVQQNDLQDLLSLVSVLRTEIKNSSLDNEEKESVLDDLDVIKEQAESDTPKQSRLKKAINGVRTFIENVAAGVTATAVAPGLLEAGKALIEKIGQVQFL